MKELIDKSFFSDYFEDTNPEGVYLLTPEESRKTWDTFLDHESRTYFQLPDDNWIVESKWNKLGFYNEDLAAKIPTRVRELLLENFDWAAEDKVWFCVNHETVIETTWQDFTKLWMNFANSENDCPILLNSNRPNQALVFTAVGEIYKVGGGSIKE